MDTMKNIHNYRLNDLFVPAVKYGAALLGVFGLMTSLGCGNKRAERGVFGSTTPIGEIAVDLDANQSCVRLKECPLGNFAADALHAYGLNKGYPLTGAFINGGGIRFNKDTRADGIYRAGQWNESLSFEIFPFGNKMAVVHLTGAQLKSTFERSVASLPKTYGGFLQVSKGMTIEVDSSKQAQKIDSTQTAITTPGERITSIKIKGVEIDPEATYSFIISDFLSFTSAANTANDGYVELRNLDISKKEVINEDMIQALQFYVSVNTPVRPVEEGRIIIK
jgi:2',3'-cyclic-nucleotide 2'-phosphodiesterase (5'-nucleotidase family)